MLVMIENVRIYKPVNLAVSFMDRKSNDRMRELTKPCQNIKNYKKTNNNLCTLEVKKVRGKFFLIISSKL